MAVIGSDGLSLLVGDGTMPTEVFTPLKGLAVTRFEINQRNQVSSAVAADAWQVSAGTSNRQAVIECEAYATNEAQAVRLRSLVFSGGAGNFKLELSAAETLVFGAVIAVYREIIGAGGIKQLQFRLESSGALTVV